MCPVVDPQPQQKAPCLSIPDPTACPDNEGLFPQSLSRLRPKDVALSFGRFLLRVWLPSRGTSSSNPWETFSAPNAHRFRSPEFLSFLRVEKFFRISLSLLVVPDKTSRPYPATSRALSPQKSRTPCLLPNGLGQGGAAYSHEPFDLSGSLLIVAFSKVISPFEIPFHP